jgi:hypothetical protein
MPANAASTTFSQRLGRPPRANALATPPNAAQYLFIDFRTIYWATSDYVLETGGHFPAAPLSFEQFHFNFIIFLDNLAVVFICPRC